MSVGRFALVAVLLSAPTSMAQLIDPPVKIPTADPVGKRIELAPIMRDGRDTPVDDGLLPPPLDQIPPIPMPEWVEQPISTDRTMTLYDATTGTWTTTPIVMVDGPTSGGVPGWRGPLPSGNDPTQNTFSSMTNAVGLGNYPVAPNCKLAMRFTAQNGNQYWFSCSGTMIDPGVVMTAAHCVYTRSFVPSGGGATVNVFNFADIIYVYPAWDGNVAPVFGAPANSAVVQNFGYSSGTFFMAGTDYINSGSFARDVGFVRLNNRHPGHLTGWMGWWFDNDCAVNFDTNCGRFFTNYSYPSEGCGPGLHTGATMLGRSGCFDACSNNQGFINTTAGCMTAVWGGSSGSSAYFTNNGTQYVRGVCSNSNRSTSAAWAMTWTQLGQTDLPNFIADTRTNNFDLQALRYRIGGALQAGQATPPATFLLGNTSNASRGTQSYTVRIYLSTNNTITSSDTLVATYFYNLSYGPLGTIVMNIPSYTLPASIPSGTYFMGVIMDPGTDGNFANNATSTWDAQQVTVIGAAPNNDTCGNAPLVSAGQSVFGSTLLATTDGAAGCGSSIGSPDVYYTFTAPCAGRYAFLTCNPSGGFDTVVSLHSGCAATTNNEIGCNDDTFCTNIRDSRVEKDFTLGENVIIRVAGFNGARGDFTFKVEPVNAPANDLCANATPIGEGLFLIDNCATGTEEGPPGGCFDRQIYNDVWFDFVAPLDVPRTVDITTCQFSDNDTMIAVYRSEGCPVEGSAFACNDDACDSLQSSVSFVAQPGERFFIRLGTYSPVDSASGFMSVATAVIQPPCAVDFNADGFLNQEDLSGFLSAFLDESIPPGPSGTSVAPCPEAPEPYDTLGYAADYNRDCNFDQEDLSGYITEYFMEAENPLNCIPG